MSEGEIQEKKALTGRSRGAHAGVESDNETGLLPCPFCGGEAAFGTVRYSRPQKLNDGPPQSVFHQVNCISCGGAIGGALGLSSQLRAMIAWNRRL